VREGALWRLERFLTEFDLWTEREHPGDDLRVIVTEWVVGRQDDPYRGVRREPGFENLWFGAVPGSDDGAGRVVVCSYWIVEAQHLLRCNSFATLGLPL
jgi:hypothetical protein